MDVMIFAGGQALSFSVGLFLRFGRRLSLPPYVWWILSRMDAESLERRAGWRSVSCVTTSAASDSSVCYYGDDFRLCHNCSHQRARSRLLLGCACCFSASMPAKRKTLRRENWQPRIVPRLRSQLFRTSACWRVLTRSMSSALASTLLLLVGSCARSSQQSLRGWTGMCQ